MKTLLFGIAPGPPLLLAVSALASYIPAVRAAHRSHGRAENRVSRARVVIPRLFYRSLRSRLGFAEWSRHLLKQKREMEEVPGGTGDSKRQVCDN